MQWTLKYYSWSPWAIQKYKSWISPSFICYTYIIVWFHTFSWLSSLVDLSGVCSVDTWSVILNTWLSKKVLSVKIEHVIQYFRKIYWYAWKNVRQSQMYVGHLLKPVGMYQSVNRGHWFIHSLNAPIQGQFSDLALLDMNKPILNFITNRFCIYF